MVAPLETKTMNDMNELIMVPENNEYALLQFKRDYSGPDDKSRRQRGKQSYSDKAIKLAIKHGYTGGWHQPNKDVFDDENFWRSAGRAFGYHEWRNLYERYLDRMRYGESNNEFWRVIFSERNCPAGCGLKFHEGITCETAKKL